MFCGVGERLETHITPSCVIAVSTAAVLLYLAMSNGENDGFLAPLSWVARITAAWLNANHGAEPDPEAMAANNIGHDGRARVLVPREDILMSLVQTMGEEHEQLLLLVASLSQELCELCQQLLAKDREINHLKEELIVTTTLTR